MVRAGKEAAVISGRSGVDHVFLNCEAGRADWRSDNTCQGVQGPAEFWFRVIVHKPKTATHEMLGFTELDEAFRNGSARVL